MQVPAAEKVMKYIGDLQSLQDLYNNHFSLGPGDETYWSDWASSPIFPVAEQPESDKFYILYNYADSIEEGSWWHIDTVLMVYLEVNNVALLGRFGLELINELADYEFAASRINKWSADNSIDGPVINYISYRSSDPIVPQDQENGVYSRLFELDVNSVVC